MIKKLTKLNARDAKRNKAKSLEYNKVKKAEIINNEWVISLQDGKKIKSKVLINASGPWINDTLNKNIKITVKILMIINVIKAINFGFHTTADIIPEHTLKIVFVLSPVKNR